VQHEPMSSPINLPFPKWNGREVGDEPAIVGLKVQGTLPAGLSGRMLAIGPDIDHPLEAGSLETGDRIIHSVHLHAGRAVSYRNQWVKTDAVAHRRGVALPPEPRKSGADIVAGNIVGFGGSILALGDGSLAYELTPDLDTVRRVDLAGQSRGLAPYPKRDPLTGALHVLTATGTSEQAHVVVSSAAFTRTSRTILGAPNPIKDLAITTDRVVFVGDGFVGVMSRDGGAHPMWVPTNVHAPYLVHAHDDGGAVIVYSLTPSLERWTLHATSTTVHCETLDPAPHRFAHCSDRSVGEPPLFLWTAVDGTAFKHDLTTATHIDHSFDPHRTPGDLVFVADASRSGDEDGGWLVGFVHRASDDQTDLVLLDAANIAAPAIATVTIPRGVPHVHHSTWVPSAHATGNSFDVT
jgi:8'-apo-carotenoid 13,14-cleaving dioxygenase